MALSRCELKPARRFFIVLSVALSFLIEGAYGIAIDIAIAWLKHGGKDVA
jgi:hypothetical protein